MNDRSSQDNPAIMKRKGAAMDFSEIYSEEEVG
jgi:hypothetical protein